MILTSVQIIIFVVFLFVILLAKFNSSFFSRYIEEHVQKTGVAIETQGFSLITSGKKRESLTVSL